MDKRKRLEEVREYLEKYYIPRPTGTEEEGTQAKGFFGKLSGLLADRKKAREETETAGSFRAPEDAPLMSGRPAAGFGGAPEASEETREDGFYASEAGGVDLSEVLEETREDSFYASGAGGVDLSEVLEETREDRSYASGAYDMDLSDDLEEDEDMYDASGICCESDPVPPAPSAQASAPVFRRQEKRAASGYFAPRRRVEDMLSQMDETFSRRLLRLIRERNLTEADVYKRAGVDRRHFAKIKKDEYYTPSKKTVLAFAIALELSLDETRELLRSAGYALSRSSKFDIIIVYFIENRDYNMFDINEVLYEYEQPVFG